MPNNYFSFKQFSIQQDQCAMKVCTDACILGAWTAAKIEGNSSLENILDIGSGTGLLTLMLAQKTTSSIDGIEIDPAAAKQAAENVHQSPWSDRIDIFNTALQQYRTDKKYDLIISNPPFFEDDLRSGDAGKNSAKHDTTLKLEELISFIKFSLSDEGSSVVLLPFHRMGYFSELLKQDRLFINETLFVKQTAAHPFFRSIILFSKNPTHPISTNELIIHDKERNYTEGFVELMKEYYLKL